MASIIVVGGGVAGLVCAWRLSRAGHNVEVLEVEASPGGRLRADRVETERGVFTVPNGASFFTSGQRNVTSVLTALGLAADVVALDIQGSAERASGDNAREQGAESFAGSVPGAIVRGGRLDPCDLSSRLGVGRGRLLSPGAHLRASRLAAERLRHRARLDPLHPERAARLERGEDALRFASRTVGGAVRDRLVAPAIETVLGCDASDVSASFLLLTLTSLRYGAAPLALEGGLPRLVSKLGESVVVRERCEVFDVETETGGARVRFNAAGRACSALADAVVVAVPASLAPVLCPKLTPDERGFFASVRYAPGMSVHLLLERQPTWARFATGFARGEGSGLRSVFQSHRVPGAAPAGAGLLSLELAESSVRRLANASDQEITSFAREALARTPLAQAAPVEAVVRRFHAARPLFAPGALSRLENFGVRLDRSPRLAFAGDYMVGPTIEGALTSGMQAASRVARSLERWV